MLKIAELAGTCVPPINRLLTTGRETHAISFSQKNSDYIDRYAAVRRKSYSAALNELVEDARMREDAWRRKHKVASLDGQMTMELYVQVPGLSTFELSR